MLNPEYRTKTVLVATLGRTGSSALMGLLRLMGAYPGDPQRLKPGDERNPKGYFELPAHQNLLLKIFEGHYPHLAAPPTVQVLLERLNKYEKVFFQVIKQEFNIEDRIAIKVPWFLPIGFWYNKQDTYDCKVIIISRDLRKQAESMLRFWQQTNSLPPGATLENVIAWAQSWYRFGSLIMQIFPLPCLNLRFEYLLNEPERYCQAISDFTGLDRLKPEVIRNWLNV